MKRSGNSKPCLGHLFLFLIVFSGWVGQSSGKKINGRSNVHPYTARSKAKAGIDTSLFEASNVNLDVRSKVYSQEGLKENDKIEKLPGQPGPVNFTQYGGYVIVDENAGRALYYYFAEAQNSKESLPLLLWLNGGPGCSSLAYGAMQELGPFRVLSDGKTLFNNKYAWNYASNLLFLESPAGVGFSYSNRTSDYDESGDRSTAEDNYLFLLNWLERFPEYKSRDFYISGESYAGHYVPQLAQTILHQNKKSNNGTIINLKGIIIGNAAINDRTDDIGMYDYFATHALIKDELAEKVKIYCYSDLHEGINTDNDTCNQITNEIDEDTSDLDIYNIYAPNCHYHGVTARPKKASIWKFDPCSDNYVHAYLNTREVQEALHANVTRLLHDWEACSGIIGWKDSASTIIPLLHEIIQNGIRVWIFSGDTDGRVPVTSTKYSINKMNISVKTEWHPWYLHREVGGYTEVYEGNLTFATVREAGHQVPSYQPSRALSLIKHFLSGTPLPSKSNSSTS